MPAQRLEPEFDPFRAAARVGRKSFDPPGLLRQTFHLTVRAHDVGAPRRRPDGQVVGIVAHIIEAALAVSGQERVPLFRAHEIDAVFGGQHRVEAAQMCRDPFGQRARAAGRQDDGAPFFSFFFDPRQNLAAIGQHANIQRRVPRQIFLEQGFALEEPGK